MIRVNAPRFDEVKDSLPPIETVEEWDECWVWEPIVNPALEGPRKYKAFMDAEGCLHWHELVVES